MREIPLTQGKIALIDDDDFDMISKFNWYTVRYRKKFYAKTSVRPKIFMHRLILAVSGSIGVDHINGDSLDNRRSNLRLCTASENQMNRGKQVNNTSGYKGVTYHRGNGRWSAKIQKNKKTIHIGYFNTPEEAFSAYCAKSVELHGAFSNTGAHS